MNEERLPAESDALRVYVSGIQRRTLDEVSDLAGLVLTHYQNEVLPGESAVQFAIRKLTPAQYDGPGA